MDVLEDLKGVNACRYIGITVSVLFTSGETVKGELYYVDFQRTQTIILKLHDHSDGENFCLVRASAVSTITALGCPNESVKEIHRVPQETLLDCLNNMPLSEDEYVKKPARNETQTRMSHQKPWTVRASAMNSLMCTRTEAVPQDNKRWAMA